MNMREHLNGPEHLCNVVSFLLRVSQSVFGTIQRRLACRCADVDTRQSRSAVKFCVAQFLRFCVSSSFSPLKGGHFAGRGITGESLRNLKIVIEHIVI